MEELLQRLFLDASDEDSEDDESQLEPLTGKELQLMTIIKTNIKKRKYKAIPKLFTASRHAESNMEMLPKIWLHVYKEVCKKNLTEEVYEENRQLFKCAEQILKRIAGCAPAGDFILEILPLLDPFNDNDCVFNSVLGVLVPPLLQLPDEISNGSIYAFEECFEEIAQRKDILPMPHWLVLGLTDDKLLLNTDEDLQCIAAFYAKISEFYPPLLKAICAVPRPATEIFRPCIANKRNILCCFLIMMLEKPLALFDLRNGCKGIPLYAVQLTVAITKCICDPFYFLNFVDDRMRWDLQANSIDTEDFDSNHFLKKIIMETECLTIYYYMVIVEEVCLPQVPRVYDPLYVCERVLYLVHYLIKETHAPVLNEKALVLAIVVLTKLGCIKLSSTNLEDFVFKEFLNDLRSLALGTITPNVLLLTLNALKQYIISFVDDVKYTILKNLLSNVGHPSFCGFLITVYKDLAALDLQKVLNCEKHLSPIYMDERLRAIFLENICKLPHGAKTDPSENHDFLCAALEAIEMFAKKDTNNVTGFWNFINEIQSQFISPLRKALQFYDARTKTEILNVRQGRGLSGKKGGIGPQLFAMRKDKVIETLKNNLSIIAKLRSMLGEVSEALANSPLLEDSNNNGAKVSAVKAK